MNDPTLGRCLVCHQSFGQIGCGQVRRRASCRRTAAFWRCARSNNVFGSRIGSPPAWSIPARPMGIHAQSGRRHSLSAADDQRRLRGQIDANCLRSDPMFKMALDLTPSDRELCRSRRSRGWKICRTFAPCCGWAARWWIDHAGGEPIRDPEERSSTSRNTRTPPSDDKSPPSNLTTTDLPETDDRPGNGSVGSFMAGMARLKSRKSASITRILRKFSRLSYTRQPPTHNPGSRMTLLCTRAFWRHASFPLPTQ